MQELSAAIVGPGNIGTDLMYKIEERGVNVSLEAMIGILPVEESDGLQAAQEHGIDVGTEGIDSLKEISDDIDAVFEATSASVHEQHAPVYDELGLFAIDMTPAAVGPFAVPSVNMDDVIGRARNVNMITCGGQGTIPIVSAIDDVADVQYAEIISTIASKSAGPGTRKNIDEFTQTTAAGLEKVGGADEGKAIIVLNPAEPPIMNRNTIYTKVPDGVDLDAVRSAVTSIADEVQSYVPGYEVTLEPTRKEDLGVELDGAEILTTMVEITGEGHYLPEYAGNLDIMTSAALGAGERLPERWDAVEERTEVAR
ncbi:MAG: acetaldehyde dehydrogenase (acetylating) [Natronomonas sp.]|jgi:acetaldehyde dehydrogenase|uniref:acetaldehyde dehydrogenase (acetylating) n=1 Tax=Natronomonas sp. TaxID=2184060 RepID=UPI00287046F1|nr:acetaldehyde dehydrogenase (acetylating) [Natronomonas sp.]MDR9429386.1 acetaldehyde dehydrogenase (acetylating) [Natronomonas sp.]